MEGSWLSQALPRYSPSSLSPEESRRHSKAPRWHTPSMSASMVPLPITSSIYSPLSPQSSVPASAPADDELLFFRRKHRQLEAHLQLLLDAQADGLLSGLDGSAADDDGGNSTGSSTPTATNLNARSRPTNKSEKVGLREARVGLYATIRRLAQLKAQESQYLGPNIDHFSSVVSQLETWEKKRHGLQVRTKQIESGQDSKRAADLQRQADVMQNDIDDLENRLSELKNEQRKLRTQAQEMENTVDARLSSYTTSLALVDENVQNFLQDNAMDRWTAVVNVADMNHFWQLPRHSRTLEAAKDIFTRERDSLLEKRKINDTEQEALEEGALVWKDAVKEVSAFERRLTKAMSRLGKQIPSTKSEQPTTEEPHESSSDTQELLALLEQTTTQLESKHKLAETRSWKLLVCAIGAELEAFLKGRQILEAALAASNPEETEGAASSSVHLEGVRTPKGSGSSSSSIKHDDGEAIRDLDKAFEAKHSGNSISDTDTEDDGPDPELLISHQDTDTE